MTMPESDSGPRCQLLGVVGKVAAWAVIGKTLPPPTGLVMRLTPPKGYKP